MCGLNDNRDYYSGGADPGADPSRNRVEASFDFTAGNVVFRVNPSCRTDRQSLSQPGHIDCSAPRTDGDGNDVTVSQPGPGVVRVETTFSEANFVVPVGVCTIHNYFDFTTDPVTHRLLLSGHGSSYPSVAIISHEQVVYADEGQHLTGLCPPVGLTGRDYPSIDLSAGG